MTGAPEPTIEVRGITKTYRLGKLQVPALKGVTLTINRGEFVAVMGPSGSGKSTFLNLLGCLDRPTAGSYHLSGVDVSTMSDDQLADIRSRRIGFVFQRYNLLAKTSAIHNVELPLYYAASAVGRDGAAHRLLSLVGLPDRARHRPNELSGGEQQRVAIARSLVNRPDLILADEPTGNLDSSRSAEIMQLLQDLNRAGMTIVLVTHEHDIAAWAGRLIRFRDGYVISDEPQIPYVAPTAAPAEPGRLRLIQETLSVGEGGRLKRRSVWSPREVAENISVALRSLWQNRLRATLTPLGILIGGAAVIAMVSVGQGAQRQIEQSIEGLGTNMLTVIPGSTREGGAQGGLGSAQSLTYDDALAIREEIPGLGGVAPEMSTGAQVSYGRNNWRTQVTGTTPDYLVVRNWALTEGTFFSDEDNRARRNVAVIGSNIATNLFGEDTPVGKRIKILQLSFTVLGVLESRGGGGFGSQDDTILVPIETLYKRYTGQKTIRSLGISVSDRDGMEAARAEVSYLLRARHELPEDGSEDDFMIMSQDDILQTMQGVTGTMTLLLASIAGISLLVGGIGIMNIMLVSVTERTREIGIRKAIGARRRDVLAQFLTEAVILSGLGGLLGWALGSLGAELIRRFGGLPVEVSLSTVGLALGFSVAVGMFFGIYPATKAARMDPIVALHYE